MYLKNSTVLITGGTSGIGLERVRQLNPIGAKIIITGRDLNKVKETQRKFPNVHIFKNDTDGSPVTAAFDKQRSAGIVNVSSGIDFMLFLCCPGLQRFQGRSN